MSAKKDVMRTDVAIVGAGPGGYVAALRLADLGHEVVLIEKETKPGGICLLAGCIPSKALIHAVEVCHQARLAGEMGLTFKDPALDIQKLRSWTQSVIQTLSNGITSLVKKRKIELIHGRAVFNSAHSLTVDTPETTTIEFNHCIIATGSRLHELPVAHGQPVWSSDEALMVPCIPESLLVIGGGFIGLEMGLVYSGLGSKVTIAEFRPRILSGFDPDLVEVMFRQVEKRLEDVLLESEVVQIKKKSSGFQVDIRKHERVESRVFQQVLMAVGRIANTHDIGLENAGLATKPNGKIPVDSQCRTAQPHIFAIGDVVEGPMLAHKATREAKISAEAISGFKSTFNHKAIPAVVFTDPEIAWTGLTEREAEEKGISVTVGRFPLTALGKAWILGRTDGLVKIISDAHSQEVLGVGMVGLHASELIAEGTLALEMGATLQDLMVTIHPHPTLSEAILEAAEVAAGAPIHVHPRRG